MGRLNILDGTGDVKIEWDADSKDEVEVAEEAFKKYLKKGFKAYRQYDAGKQGEKLEEFDKYAEKVIFIPPLKGGNAELADLR